MSHSASKTVQIELEHLEMIGQQFNAILAELEIDIRSAVTPEGKLALRMLQHIAQSGVTAASTARESMIRSSLELQSSH